MRRTCVSCENKKNDRSDTHHFLGNREFAIIMAWGCARQPVLTLPQISKLVNQKLFSAFYLPPYFERPFLLILVCLEKS
jgi:hypothetical protein